MNEYSQHMTVDDLRRGIEQSTPEQRFLLAAFIKHLARKDDPEYQKDLARLNQEIDDGKKFTFDQVKRMHQTLAAEGL